MRLLIVTQAVDRTDPILGFFHQWLVEFANRVESLEVICLYEGSHALPNNVTVHSLGKERARQPSIVYALRFLSLAYVLRNRYDAVFVHMNPEYLCLAGVFWRALSKRTSLWYMHKTVSLRLRLGVLLVDTVFTASPRSMRVQTRKKRVVGHGIALDRIAPVLPPSAARVSLLTIGRISRVKRLELIIDAVGLLVAKGLDAHLTIAGAPAGRDGVAYADALVLRARRQGIEERVLFVGSVPNDRIGELLENAHLFVHASNTGSLDKASLEPLAAGVPVVTVDPELGAAGIPGVVHAEPAAEAIAAGVEGAVGKRLWENQEIRSGARAYVAEHHSLPRLIERILAEMSVSVHG